MLTTIVSLASAADLKKLADELVNQAEPPAVSDGDLDGDGRADVSAHGMEGADISRGARVDAGRPLDAPQARRGQDLDRASESRRTTEVDAGNALNARQATRGQAPEAAPDHQHAAKVDAGNALNARRAGQVQALEAVRENRRAGDPIPGIDITVNQGH